MYICARPAQSERAELSRWRMVATWGVINLALGCRSWSLDMDKLELEIHCFQGGQRKKELFYREIRPLGWMTGSLKGVRDAHHYYYHPVYFILFFSPEGVETEPELPTFPWEWTELSVGYSVSGHANRKKAITVWHTHRPLMNINELLEY